VHEWETSRALCLGEAMGVLHPDQPGGLTTSSLLRCSVGGAEANVAGALAALGVETTWLSRLGNDPLGELVASDLTRRGVTVLAERDEERPTGLYLKEITDTGSRMHYYRNGSAATALTGSALTTPATRKLLPDCDVVHTSGITAGILTEQSDLLTRLAEIRDSHGFLLSVDLNWRTAVWHDRDTSRLWQLLRDADVLLLGSDEAAAALGTSEPERLRALLGDRPRLVMKSDAHQATEIDPDGSTTTVPALDVDVVEPVGAGDGFAAGYLAALLAGHDSTRRLRQGHLLAAGVLAQPGDHAPPPESATRRVLLEANSEDWNATRVGPSGISSPALARTGGRG